MPCCLSAVHVLTCPALPCPASPLLCRRARNPSYDPYAKTDTTRPIKVRPTVLGLHEARVQPDGTVAVAPASEHDSIERPRASRTMHSVQTLLPLRIKAQGVGPDDPEDLSDLETRYALLVVEPAAAGVARYSVTGPGATNAVVEAALRVVSVPGKYMPVGTRLEAAAAEPCAWPVRDSALALTVRLHRLSNDAREGRMCCELDADSDGLEARAWLAAYIIRGVAKKFMYKNVEGLVKWVNAVMLSDRDDTGMNESARLLADMQLGPAPPGAPRVSATDAEGARRSATAA